MCALGHLQPLEQRYESQQRGLHIQPMHPGAQFQDLPAREIRIKHRIIRQEPDEPLHRYPILEAIHAIDPHGAATGLQDAHEQAEERRLARPIRPQQAANLPVWHRPGHVFESGLQSEALRHSFDLH